jgi:SNF2 family DNA or RNA helicase
MTAPTLAEYFQRAGIERYPSFAPFVQLKHTPFQSQVEGLSLCVHYQWFGLLDETGAGKSIPVVGAALHYIGLGNKVVVLTLATLIYQFAESVTEEFQGVDKYVRVHVLDEPPAKRAKLIEQWDSEGWPEMMVMSYELFSHQKLCKILKEKGYDVLITDESQKWKSPESTLAKRIGEYVGDPAQPDTAFFPMTGTPMHTYMSDCYTLITFMSPGAYLSYDHFCRRHCRYKLIRLKVPKITSSGKRISRVKELVGYQRHAELSANLYARCRRVLKSQIPELRDLKEPIITEVPVRLSPAHREAYRKLTIERFIDFGDGTILSALQEQELRQKVLQIVTCPELFLPEGTKIDNQVLATCRDLTEAHTADSKVILFVNFRETVARYAEFFADMNPATMNGDLSATQRKAMTEKFLNDPTCRLLVANPRSAGAGFNFQGVSHTVIFAEPTGSPGEFKQAMDRVVRPGQLWQCNIYVLKALETLAPNAIRNMLRRDQDIGQVTLDPRTLRHFYNVA